LSMQTEKYGVVQSVPKPIMTFFVNDSCWFVLQDTHLVNASVIDSRWVSATLSLAPNVT
jgi:hypothetical protein